MNNTRDDPYGYTGEWWGSYLNLLYLRARWYLAETGTFLSRDPVESEPPYIYARGNPVNHTDPSGHCIVQWSGEVRMGQYPYGTSGVCPHTESRHTEMAYDATALHTNPSTAPTLVPALLSKANGYVEGRVKMFSAVGCVWTIVGEEIVYDFQSRQRQKFSYTHAPWNKRGYAPVPGLAFSIWSGSEAAYGGFLWGFTGNGIVNDYSEYFVGTSLGASTSIFKKLGFNAGPGVGWGQFTGTGNKPFGAVTGGEGIVSGDVAYFSLNTSTDAGLLAESRLRFLPIDASMSGTWYTEVQGRRVDEYTGKELEMLEDVRSADASPVGSIPLMLGNGFYDPDIRKMGANVGTNTFVKNGWITAMQ